MGTTTEALNQILSDAKTKWYYRWFPFLPRLTNNKHLRLFTLQWRDCSYATKPVGQPHCLELLIANHASPWYKPNLVGIQIWY
jgi:hypothetical protein